MYVHKYYATGSLYFKLEKVLKNDFCAARSSALNVPRHL